MCECTFLELHVGMQINLGCLRRFVTEPESDHALVYTAPQQVHGCRVSERVRRHRLWYERGTGLTRGSSMARHEPLKCIGAEMSAARTGEDGIAGLCVLPR